MPDSPKISDAPGLGWRKRKDGWAAIWYARPDLIAKGFPIKTHRVWRGEWPDTDAENHIRATCQSLQTDMLTFGKPLPQLGGRYDGTIGGLIDAYQTDPDSDYHKIRHASRRTYNVLLNLIRKSVWTDQDGNTRQIGGEALEDLKARIFLRWYEQWLGDGKVAQSHYLMTMLRLLFSFGSKFLDDKDAAECQRLSGLLHTMKFKNPRPRSSILTAEQVVSIRKAAHAAGRPSLALAQAIQFECTLRQKDVIGEWVPMGEPGVSLVAFGSQKWMRGITWNEITRTGDGCLILRHVTSKRQKEIEVDLTKAPMVVEELARLASLPTSGPVIADEKTGLPYVTVTFRELWRKLARSCGIPDSVRNMDSRAGAITEGLIATGGDLDSVRIAATHSNVSTTMGYSRGNAERTAAVMDKRARSRNNSGTDAERTKRDDDINPNDLGGWGYDKK
jgi:hypothetical protein